MFHVEQPETQMRAILIWVFLTFLNFWRGGASSSTTTIFVGVACAILPECGFDVKSFLHVRGKLFTTAESLAAPIIQ